MISQRHLLARLILFYERSRWIVLFHMKGKPVLTEAVSCSMIFIHSRRNLLSVIFLQRRSCRVRSLAGSAGISFMFVVFSDFLNGKECNEFQYNFICRRRRTAGGTDPCGGGRVERAARVPHGRVSFIGGAGSRGARAHGDPQFRL